MHLENLVVDASDPRALGRFWEQALGTETLTDGVEGFETRLSVPGGPVLDLCFQPVPQPPDDQQRLHLELRGDEQQQELVARLLALGARRTGAGHGSPPDVVLADPEGTAFSVLAEPTVDRDTGPVAVLPLASADPGRDRDFWGWLTGWVPVEEGGQPGLRHPSGQGPLLQLRPEARPKSGKNRMHLDLRLEGTDDLAATAAEVIARGGSELHPDWGDLPWRVFTDPSGNEFCLLPPHPEPASAP